MGWWSTNINGGDTPMDIEGALCDFMGLDQEADDFDGVVESGKLTTEVVYAFLGNKGSKIIKSMHKSDELSILYSVLGELLMEAGATINEEFRALIIEHANTDTWAEESPERRVIIEEFCEAMESYTDGEASTLPRGDFMDRATTPGYIGNYAGTAPIDTLENLMPRIGGILVTKPDEHPKLWNVVGYQRGMLICRDKHTEVIITKDEVRDLLNHKEYVVEIYEFIQLTATDA